MTQRAAPSIPPGSVSAQSPASAQSPVPAATSRRPRAPARAVARFWTRLRRDAALLLMTAPAALLLLIFHYLPTTGNLIAFQDYNPFLGDGVLDAFFQSDWVGGGNFQALFEDASFWEALRNTLSITLFQLLFFFPLP